jgi:hypothetical protein
MSKESGRSAVPAFKASCCHESLDEVLSCQSRRFAVLPDRKMCCPVPLGELHSRQSGG